MTALVTMREALSDPALLGDVMPGDSWAGWRALLIAAMGEELTADERELFRTLTGRDHEPGECVEELWAVVGRRGGKTRAAAVVAVYLAALVDYSDKLAIGERAVLPFIATTTKQARKAFGYAAGILESTPMLRGLITNRTAETIALSTRVDLEIQPASWRGNRGDTSAAVIGDEAAFWRDDTSANPDTEILNALRPSLATTGGPLIIISSPYARRGELYTTWKRHYGASGDPLILVAQAPSRVLNPSLSQKVIDRAMERDPAAAMAEWGAQFRTDVEACLTIEAVEAVTRSGARERGRIGDVTYFGFVDPSGGSADSMTMAIGHKEGSKAILDVIREVKPPFSPEAVVADFSADFKRYGVRRIEGDRYAGEWAREPFRKLGIEYVATSKPKVDLYRDLIPRVNSGEVELLDMPRLASQLVSLERRTSRGGRDTIDHPPRGHDDVANAAAGVLVLIFDRTFSTAKPGTTRMATYGYGGQVHFADDKRQRAWERRPAPQPITIGPHDHPAPAVPQIPYPSISFRRP
ncbi:hypothetical protein [Fulvimarina sp. MAC3]|uniref:hypothetical protein n=1 Tax=Fulvimarina sp. MAC3 TaxID=3148887 RepID=UPI0031FD07A8